MGSVFVHTLTEAYMKCNGMNILRSLNIAERGLVSLCMDVYGNKQDAAYYTSTNGGMKFESGWFEFIEEFDLNDGNIVLILFSHLKGVASLVSQFSHLRL